VLVTKPLLPTCVDEVWPFVHTATSRHHWDSTDALLADRKGDGGDGGVITDLLELVSYVVDISFGCE
jgi:hypothetical protein